MMARKSWVYLATLLTVVVYVYSEEENDPDQILNDSDGVVSRSFSPHPGNGRMTRGRNGGGGGGVMSEDVEDERGLPREERKRIKAERRRLKEERRQERWARRRQLKQEGHRGRLDEVTDNPEAEARDVVVHRPHHNQVISRGVPVTLSSSSSSSGVPGSSGGLLYPHSIHAGDSSSSSSSSSLPSSGHTGASGSSNSVDVETLPTVVDLEWMRANLSALWSVVRTLSRQGRPFLHRGGRGRHHHSGVPAEPPNPAACPGREDACRSEGGEICGGQGVCSCGHCFCHPGYYGTFCQCYDHSCPVYDGMTCGGPSRGQCRCGGCICRPGYAGESCECPTDNQTCISPDSDTILCSGKGTCECGRCRCGDGHKGMYCEDTVYAASVCEKLKSCVMCKAWKRELPSCAQCQITVTTVDSLEPSMTTCVMVNSGCLLQFSYIPQTADAYTVLVPRDMVCPT